MSGIRIKARNVQTGVKEGVRSKHLCLRLGVTRLQSSASVFLEKSYVERPSCPLATEWRRSPVSISKIIHNQEGSCARHLLEKAQLPKFRAWCGSSSLGQEPRPSPGVLLLTTALPSWGQVLPLPLCCCMKQPWSQKGHT